MDDDHHDDAVHDGRPRLLRLLEANGRAAWQFVGIAVALAVLGVVFARLQLVLLAIFVALVHAAIVTPFASWLERRGFGRTPAAAVALLLVVTVLGGITGVVGYRLVSQAPDLAADLREQREPVLEFLARPPLSLTEDEVRQLLGQAVEEASAGDGEGQGEAAPAADAVTPDEGADEQTEGDGEGPSPSVTFELLAGSAVLARLLGAAAIGVVISFFLVRDRDTITDGVVRHLAGGPHDERARSVLRAGWYALDGYVRGSVVIGAVEAVLIGGALLVVGTPLAGSLAVLTFLAAFVPVAGATAVGILSVGVTWLGVGAAQAVVIAVVVLVVQQADGQLLQPAVMATHTRLHPVATILALMVGGIVGGLLGALLAVPAAAVLTAVTRELLATTST